MRRCIAVVAAAAFLASCGGEASSDPTSSSAVVAIEQPQEVSTSAVTPGSSSTTAGLATSTSPSPMTTVPVVTVDEILRECPTAAAVESVLSRVDVRFESDATAPLLVCTAAAGSADMTRLHERTVQALLIMDRIEFDEPLPWTDLQLFDWFSGAISGIRFEEVEYSSCCDSTGYMSIKSSGLSAVETERWINPSSGTGLFGLVGLLVHEARHNEGKAHTCPGSNDATFEEMGSWAVQAYLFEWLAQHVDQSFFATTDPWPGYYTDQMLFAAERIVERRICQQQ